MLLTRPRLGYYELPGKLCLWAVGAANTVTIYSLEQRYFLSLDTGNRRQHSTMTSLASSNGKRWGSCTPCVPLHSRHEMLPPRIATASRQTSWGICAVQPKPPRKHSTQTTINTTSLAPKHPSAKKRLPPPPNTLAVSSISILVAPRGPVSYTHLTLPTKA